MAGNQDGDAIVPVGSGDGPNRGRASNFGSDPDVSTRRP